MGTFIQDGGVSLRIALKIEKHVGLIELEGLKLEFVTARVRARTRQTPSWLAG